MLRNDTIGFSSQSSVLPLKFVEELVPRGCHQVWEAAVALPRLLLDRLFRVFDSLFCIELSRYLHLQSPVRCYQVVVLEPRRDLVSHPPVP